MRIIYIFVFLCAFSLNACPFASGSYKRIPKKDRLFKSVQFKRSLHFDKMASGALLSYLSEFEKQGFSLCNDLKYLESVDLTLASNLKNLFKIVQNSQSSFRSKSYCNYLFSLRHVCQYVNDTKFSDLKLKETVHLLSRIHFEADLKHSLDEIIFFEKVVAAYPAPKKYNELSIEELNHFFSDSLNLKPSEKWLEGIRRYLQRSLLKEWDSALISLRFCWGYFESQAKQVKVLRMGCPVMLQNNRHRVDPIFMTYLDALRDQKKKHLYINLMNQTQSGWEKKASLLLKEISQQSDFRDSFFYISLPYNGPFYQQESLSPRYANEFIQEFKKLILKHENGFYFPPIISENIDFESDVEYLLKDTHSKFFQNKQSLTQKERWQFIDLIYAHLSSYSMQKLDIDSVNWTCRHGIDRAMSAFTVFERLHQRESKESLKHSIFYAYMPSFLFYSRAPACYHAMRTLAALDKIEEQGALNLNWTSHFNTLNNLY